MSEKLPIIEANVEKAFQSVLDALLINTAIDPHTKDTAKRVAKMYCREIFVGAFTPCPEVTLFENEGTREQEPYFVGPIPIRSTCAHHFLPIVGRCWIIIRPGPKVMGLSKFSRLVDWQASRPQIQETLTNEIAELVRLKAEAWFVGVCIEANHSCMTMRGVEDACGGMTTFAWSFASLNAMTEEDLKERLFVHVNARK